MVAGDKHWEPRYIKNKTRLASAEFGETFGDQTSEVRHPACGQGSGVASSGRRSAVRDQRSRSAAFARPWRPPGRRSHFTNIVAASPVSRRSDSVVLPGGTAKQRRGYTVCVFMRSPLVTAVSRGQSGRPLAGLITECGWGNKLRAKTAAKLRLIRSQLRSACQSLAQ
jgi:hypothetical protein